MGMLNDFKKSLAESPGRILWGQLQDTQQKMARLNPEVCANALAGFVQMRDHLIPMLDNMTKDGQLKTAKEIQDGARQSLDMDVGKGYAMWLTGAWLESMNRPGIEAARVCDFLDQTAISGGGKQY